MPILKGEREKKKIFKYEILFRYISQFSKIYLTLFKNAKYSVTLTPVINFERKSMTLTVKIIEIIFNQTVFFDKLVTS